MEQNVYSDHAADWKTEESLFDSCQGNKTAVYEDNISDLSSVATEYKWNFFWRFADRASQYIYLSI